MKKIYNYVTFIYAIIFSIVIIWIFFAIGEVNVFLLVLICISIINWLVFFFCYWRNKWLQKNAKYVYAKLIPESVRKIPFIKCFIIRVTVTYFDSSTGQSLLFKGHCMGVLSEYFALKSGNDIWVRVAYSTKNSHNYMVFLEEALKALSTF